MKIFVCFAVVFGSLSLSSAVIKPRDKIEFKCVNLMPQTSFILKSASENSEDLVLTTIHHNGNNFMPIHEGVIVPNDFNYLAGVARVLTLMGDRNEFKFPRHKCKIYGPGQMSCVSGSSEVFQGREMQALYLNTSTITEKAFGQTYDRIKVTLSVHISNFAPVQDIVMYYETNECQLSF